MRKSFLLICFFLQIASYDFAQNQYIPFPENFISYGYVQRSSSVLNNFSAHRMEIKGDTVFNGIHYSKYYLAEKFPPNGGDGYPNSGGSYATLLGGIRNDIPAKKVYLYLLSTKQEELLYDFNLNVGDTLFKNQNYGYFRSLLISSSLPVTIDTAWVTRIDSIFMKHDGQYHKKFNFNALLHHSGQTAVITTDSLNIDNIKGCSIRIDPLVEGYGVLYERIRELGFTLGGNSFYVPFCASIDGRSVYNNQGTAWPPFMHPELCSSIFTNVNEHSGLVNASVYPNPTSGKFKLQLTDFENHSYEIYNLVGERILNADIKSEQTEIDLGIQSKSIYFIRVFNSNTTVYTQTLIVN